MLAALPATASASKGSILPSSLAIATFPGTQSFAVDLRFVGARPCALVEEQLAGATTINLSCGPKLGERHRLDVSTVSEHPTHLDVTSTFIDVAGYTTPTKTIDQPLLVRTDTAGNLLPTFGTGGVANLDVLAQPGMPSVHLTSVDAAENGTTVVAGVAEATSAGTGDRAVVVARLTAAGTLDPTFGTAGVRVIRVPGLAQTSANDLRVLDDGTVLIIGGASASGTAAIKAFAALLDSAGNLVPSFDGDGIAQPVLGSATTTSLISLPTAPNAGAFPIVASASSNVKKQIRPFVVQLTATGGITAGWGGTALQKLQTLTGTTIRDGQAMDVEVGADGSIYGAGELELEGDTDSFVARFSPANGAPDRTYGTEMLEQIDTRPGFIDNEFSSAVAIDPAGATWVVGGAAIKGVGKVHLYRTRGGSSSAKVFPVDLSPIDAKGNYLKCGDTKRLACKVKRGAALRVGTNVKGWDPSASPLVRPVFHIWSRAPRKDWVASEKLGSTFRSGNSMTSIANLRLPVGSHEIIMTRNGGLAWGTSYVGTIYVTVA